ncbi:hypothetical protein [Terrisporobacter sp.]|uniref:hypothetical protein n=1 Tax=Terrisporobacter sp. TaxID=1965305 RepID=UPI00263617FF|nr:hypothetical protein [Terrisporobacter sp.]
MTKVHNFNKYLLEKCLIGNGIINGIINAIVFYALHKSEPDAIFMTTDIVIDLAATSLILGFILSLIVLPLTNKDVNSGKITKQEVTNKIVGFLPKNKWTLALAVGAVTMVVITIVTWALVMILSLSPLTVKTMGIFKGIMCSIAGMVAGYLTIMKAVSVESK